MIPLRLNQNIEDNTVLINGSPEVMSDTVDLEKDLVQMPFVADPGKAATDLVGEMLTELARPAGG